MDAYGNMIGFPYLCLLRLCVLLSRSVNHIFPFSPSFDISPASFHVSNLLFCSISSRLISFLNGNLSLSSLPAMSPDVWSGLRKLRVFRLGRRFLSRVLFPRFSQLTDLSIAVGSRVAVPHTLAVLAKLQR